MCMQCVVDAVVVLPEFFGIQSQNQSSLMIGKKDSEDWPIGMIGFVEYNDPTFIFTFDLEKTYYPTFTLDTIKNGEDYNKMFDEISESVHVFTEDMCSSCSLPKLEHLIKVASKNGFNIHTMSIFDWLYDKIVLRQYELKENIRKFEKNESGAMKLKNGDSEKNIRNFDYGT